MNSWQFTPVVIVYITAVWTALLLAFTTWKLRSVKSIAYFSVMSFSASIWALGYLLGFFNTDLAVKLAMVRIEYLGNVLTVTLWLLFSIYYTRHERLLSPPVWFLIIGIPMLTILQILYVDQHTFFYRSYELGVTKGMVVFNKEYGPGFYLWATAAYVFIFGGALLFIRRILNTTRKERRQSLGVMLIVVAALIPNFLYLTSNNPIAPYDPTSITFVVIGFIFLASLRWIRFFDLVPVAHDLVLDNLTSGVIILDNLNEVMEINPTAEKILNCTQELAVGRPISSIFPKHAYLEGQILETVEYKTQIELPQIGIFELQAFPIINSSSGIQGRVIMLYDITAWKMAELELRKQATTDPLTGIFNRRHFFTLAEASFQQARRYQHPLSILMIDLDHFKDVNDTYGHATGDQVLQNFARHLVSNQRTADICGRYGGEEFIILMPETCCKSAANSANRLRQWIAENPIQVGPHLIYLTISAGVAELDIEHDKNVDSLINRADQALYFAKGRGRNQVAIADQDCEKQMET